MPASVLTLQIGNIQITDIAVPQKLPTGGSQAAVVHDFPGGTRTIQTFGAFPRPIEWAGIWQGPNAMAQSMALDQARVQGQEVTLSFGPAQWKGIIAEYSGDIQNQWLIPYTIRFEPRIDLSGQAAVPPTQATTEAQLAGAQANLNAYTAAPPAGISIPAAVSSAVTAMNSAINSALQDASGLVASISAADLTACNSAISAAQSAISVNLTTSLDSATAATGADLAAYVGLVSLLLNSGSAPAPIIVVLINPNLFFLAAQYLGDATLWAEIAELSGLVDPQPIGTYTISIPAVAS